MASFFAVPMNHKKPAAIRVSRMIPSILSPVQFLFVATLWMPIELQSESLYMIYPVVYPLNYGGR